MAPDAEGREWVGRVPFDGLAARSRFILSSDEDSANRYSRDAIKLRAANTRRNEAQASEDGHSSANGNDSAGPVVADNHSPQDDQNPRSVPGHHEGPADQGVSPAVDSSATPGRSAYRDVSWSSMFSHFLDSRQQGERNLVDKCSITYLGESFPLALVLEDLQDGGSLRLHHPGPSLEENSTTPGTTPDRAHPTHLLPEDMNCLLSKKAFDYPDRAAYNALISTFLDIVFPLYPIINRDEFIKQYENDSLPWLLLQSSCFVAATFCPESILHRAGYTGRRQARFSFYRKAKALFDTGYESNKIVILQSVFMLSFWGGAPNTYWNFYTWISTGVTLAETLGIHRSLRNTNMHPKDAALLKRLWWALMIRDAFCSTLLGRPFRINTDMGDVEMLTVEDFEDYTPGHGSVGYAPSNVYGLYQISVAKLSLILRQIVYTRWLPGRMKNSSDVLQTSILNWRRELPPALDWGLAASPDNMFTPTLSMLHDHHLILAHLGSQQNDATGSAMVMEQAAQRISTVASSIVVRSQFLNYPHETFQALFLAGVASYTQLRSPQPTVAQLGRSTLSNCMMALRSVYDNWDAASWVMDLFEKLSTATPQAPSANGSSRSNNEVQGLDWLDFDPNGNLDLGIGSPWPSNPMLSALFDFPTEFGNIEQYGEVHTGATPAPG
ncbi:uncharacterized protein LTR77_001900 [Saxophila tyrrhenica]|uniref:Xylanolytic transcriptional activator regulatory domain-containing protein n=1 Tax=Saxophila tyrrhenica TaxID=1690608 RepID=A0AAV9PR80_9PEZI|nr:hypothetical protein LTR77_001900 [Saxophila tyrrhenica]